MSNCGGKWSKANGLGSFEPSQMRMAGFLRDLYQLRKSHKNAEEDVGRAKKDEARQGDGR